MRDELAAAQSTAMQRSVLAAGDALAELECAMKHRSEEEGLRADIGARLPHAIQPSSRALSVGELRGIREELRQGRRGAPVLLPREAFGEKLRGSLPACDTRARGTNCGKGGRPRIGDQVRTNVRFSDLQTNRQSFRGTRYRTAGSTRRSFATIFSGLCIFLAIPGPPQA